MDDVDHMVYDGGVHWLVAGISCSCPEDENISRQNVTWEICQMKKIN